VHTQARPALLPFSKERITSAASSMPAFLNLMASLYMESTDCSVSQEVVREKDAPDEGSMIVKKPPSQELASQGSPRASDVLYGP
jgi:hypothetical protein